MLGIQDINALGNILDFTLRGGGDGKSGVTYTLQGDVLSLRFSTIVYFASERSMRDQVAVVGDESMQRLKNVISSMKKQFKDKLGYELKVKELSNKDNLEIIQATAVNPRKIAYYRRFIDVGIDV